MACIVLSYLFYVYVTVGAARLFAGGSTILYGAALLPERYGRGGNGRHGFPARTGAGCRLRPLYREVDRVCRP